MSRKRKSAPPRRLDSAAREEHNWEANKEDAVLLPPPPAPAVSDVVSVEDEKDKDVILIEDEEPSSTAKPKSVLEILNNQFQKYEESLDQPVPPRARKKQRPAVAPTFSIPFNSSSNQDTSGYVEIKNIVVDCERHNEKFFEDIKSESSHLYARFVSSESTSCDFVTTNGEVMASSDLPLPQKVIASLLVLQKKGKAYLDAFPVKATPLNQITIRVLLAPSAFVHCTATNSNTRGLNNHTKEVINHFYNISTYDDSKNININNTDSPTITTTSAVDDQAPSSTSTAPTTTDSSSTPSASTAPTDSTQTSTSTTSIPPSPKPTVQTEEVIDVDAIQEEGEEVEEVEAPDATPQHSFDPNQVYNAVKPTNQEQQLDASTLSHALVPTLRPYQLRASYWMLQRETAKKKEKENKSDILHPLWTECTSTEGKKFYYNSITGVLTYQRFTVDEGEFSDTIPGGILADEPGLGKTLEMLALILSNPSNLSAPPPTENVPVTNSNGRVKKGKGKRKANGKTDTKGKGKAAEKKVEEVKPTRGRRHKIDDEEDDDSNDEDFAPSSSASPRKPSQPAKKKAKAEEKSEADDDLGESTCVCGEAAEKHPEGTWVCCDECDVWSFAVCALGPLVTPLDLERDFVCAKCEQALNPQEEIIEARGTLIVCPLAIREQWRQEIERHSVPGALSVRVYHGVRYGDHVSAKTLAQYDIVLTTYDVLRTEVDHLDTSGREAMLRNKKRYLIEPTPLANLIWWRVCLDEAQMVESTSTKAAAMALHLNTRHRWCVTGTPIQRGLEDLFGLLLFLQASPFDDRFWWHNAIQVPYEQGIASAEERLHKFLKPIMWRNTKADVTNELQLPAQIEKEVKLLRFSAVESTFYRKQHEECSIKARAVLKSFSNRKSPITTRLRSAKILRPLLRLRQACCHPQVGSRGIRALQKNSLTMDELLDHLSMTAKVDCQEAQRAVLSHMNGLAALHAIDKNNNAAAEKYREALRLIESNESIIEADKMQQLHIYHNLAEIVAEGNLTSNTLRDSTIKDKADALRNQLVAYREHVATEEIRKFRDASAKVTLDPSFYRPPGASTRTQTWWIEAVAFLDQYRLLNELVNRLAQREGNNKSATVWKTITDAAGLAYTLTTAFDELFKARSTLLDKVNELDVPLTRNDVAVGTSCSICAHGSRKVKGIVCQNCICFGLIETYQQNLFSIVHKKDKLLDDESDDEEKEGKDKDEEEEEGKEDEGTVNEFWWGNKKSIAFGESEFEHILQEIVSLVRLHDRSNPMLQAAQLQFEALGAMREECKKIAAFIVAKKDLVNVMDEVDMAITRIRLRYPGEQVLPGEEIFKLHPSQVEETRSRLTTELVVHETELKKMKGQLHYLKSLAEARKRQALRKQLQAKARAIAAENLTTRSLDAGEGSSSAPAQPNLHITSTPSTDETPKSAPEEKSTTTSAEQTNANLNPENPATSTSTSTTTTSDPTSTTTTTTATTISPTMDDDESTCPVCREPFSSDVVILTCGHTFCYECMMFMIERIRLGNTFKCPTCRTRVNIDEISYVSEGGNQGEYSHINVKGSWGTKIEEVVRQVLVLKQEDPTTKALLFSQWNEVLEIVSRALAENGVKFARVQGKRSVEKAINTFKKEATTTVLLLPVASGANGLNLVEATHVFLIDPLLNPAAEAQAINRVHRIGQSKVTLIHRFIVGGTIEEKVWSLGKHKAEHQHSDFWRMQSKKEHDLLTLQDFCELFADSNGNV